MNKKLIKEHKAKFDAWLKGSRLAVKYRDKLEYIRIDGSRIFSTDNYERIESIIIDDRYAEFRIALEEGKTVQVYKSDKWQTVSKDYIFYVTPLENIRIKWELQVGDWYVNKNRNGYATPFQLVDYHIANFDYNKFEKWEPIKGEWVWVSNYEKGFRELARFHQVHKLGYVVNCYGIENSEEVGPSIFKFCEPFIGKLPSTISE